MNFNRKSLDGTIVDIHKKEPLNRVNGVLVYNSKPICIYRSLNGKQHFANNVDNNGLFRGALTYAIAYADRINYTTEGNITKNQRFTTDQIQLLTSKWNKYIRPNSDFILFTDEFFEEDVKVLEQIAKDLNITV